MKLQEEIGQQVKSARKEKGLSQQTLSETIGTDQKYLSNIERGQANVTLSTLEKLAHALKMKVKILFTN